MRYRRGAKFTCLRKQPCERWGGPCPIEARPAAEGKRGGGHRTQAAAAKKRFQNKSPAGFHRRGSLGCVNKKVTTLILAGSG